MFKWSADGGFCFRSSLCSKLPLSSTLQIRLDHNIGNQALCVDVCGEKNWHISLNNTLTHLIDDQLNNTEQHVFVGRELRIIYCTHMSTWVLSHSCKLPYSCIIPMLSRKAAAFNTVCSLRNHRFWLYNCNMNTTKAWYKGIHTFVFYEKCMISHITPNFEIDCVTVRSTHQTSSCS